MTEINKRSPSNKRVALGKKVRINNRRGYYYSITKSKHGHFENFAISDILEEV